MKTEGSLAQSVDKKKFTLNPFTRGLIATSLATTAAFNLAACAPAEKEETAPTPDLYSVGDVLLDTPTQEAREKVFDLCLNSESGKELAQRWEDYDFDETTGKPWSEAFPWVADLQYSTDPKAIVNDGGKTYPTVASLAENCLEAAYLFTLPVSDIAYKATAVPKLEAFRASDLDEGLTHTLKMIAEMNERGVQS